MAYTNSSGLLDCGFSLSHQCDVVVWKANTYNAVYIDKMQYLWGKAYILFGASQHIAVLGNSYKVILVNLRVIKTSSLSVKFVL